MLFLSLLIKMHALKAYGLTAICVILFGDNRSYAFFVRSLGCALFICAQKIINKRRKGMGMVTMNCPGCGSPVELDDSREFGFCTYCGAKVMVDRMIVEHKGSVKIDNSEFVQKNLQNARRALSKEDWEEVEKYYNIVEQNAPHNMEAVFFSAYGKALLSLTDTDYFKREQKFKVLNNSISVLNDYFEETDENKEEVLKRIAEYIDKLQVSEYVYNRQSLDLAGALNSLSNATGTNGWCRALLASTKTAFLTELKQIAEKHDEAYIKELIEKYEPAQPADSSSSGEQKKSGCYVATAVYGSYDCPQVWTLRRYRDYRLDATWYGRLFIMLYYAISPTLVKWFGHTEWFKKMWKGKLDRMVERLRAEGYEDTPYNDKY